jgi:hypothetical protein
MKSIYRLEVPTKNSHSNINFSLGVQEKLSKYLWESKNIQSIDKRFIPSGESQKGLTDSFLKKTDYLSAPTSIPIFSERLADNLLKNAPNEINFLPCKIISKSFFEYDFYIGIIKTFLPLLNIIKTENAEALSPLAPIIFNENLDDFYIARDESRTTLYAASQNLKDLCQKNKFLVNFAPVDFSISAWVNKQNDAVKRKFLDMEVMKRI